MEQLNFFHDWVMIFVSSIAVGVLWYLVILMSKQPSHRSLIEAQGVEFGWTALPCLVLVAIALPSLRLLYMVDESGSPELTIKTVGHQWYWSYEYSDLNEIEFDSYMTSSPYRLLDCDHRILFPSQTPIRVLVTAADVLHSWTVPTMGIKADAVPGRLNQLTFFSDRSGMFFGQCSEICGSNHSFMPISVECIPSNKFGEFLMSMV
uniref:Cytochrome c oxidase subunit 2 n=2 Tax=Parasagitta setosa TaxID=366441 RepID=A0A141CKJ7_9BILA|nr:cytochrome c oxidase subunit 2 [Parasagitta setosa]AKS04137.1 cytochrome c oxidase subunit 2 [Parasagitta setosa]